MLRRNGTRRHVVWCVSERRASEGRAVALWRFEAKMSSPAENGSAPGGAPLWSPRGLNLIQVCARWCPTLPHPGGCSTIGAVRLSFRVRDGAGRFPVAVTTETTTWAVRDDRHLWCGYSVIGSPCNARCACVGGWVGCGPYSGRFALLCLLTPGTPTHTSVRVVCVGGCCCLCWPISTSQLTDRCRSSTSGLSTQ